MLLYAFDSDLGEILPVTPSFLVTFSALEFENNNLSVSALSGYFSHDPRLLEGGFPELDIFTIGG